MQALVIPLDERGKLNAREPIGGKAKLSQMQSEFPREVGQIFGSERGQLRSRATCQTVKEYYCVPTLWRWISASERRVTGEAGTGLTSRLRPPEAPDSSRDQSNRLPALLAGRCGSASGADPRQAGAASGRVVGPLKAARENAPEGQENLRKLAGFYNRHALAFRKAGLVPLAGLICSFAWPHHPCGSQELSRLSHL